ncbi:hypothetical protein ZWY2020_006001 [Hordeum vulgare]|nr:hypothetical protein ZWY2020_006001 [Hordeum vulgare]
MDAYLSSLMNDNANPDNLFVDEYYLFIGEGSNTDDLEHDKVEDSTQLAMRTSKPPPACLTSSLYRGGRQSRQEGPTCRWPVSAPLSALCR